MCMGLSERKSFEWQRKKERKKEKHTHTHKLNTDLCVCFSAFDNGGMLLLHSELL